MESWKFRDEVLRAVNQWYLVLGSVVIGALAAFVLSYLLPAPYRATAELYLGIDVVRVNEMEYLIPLAAEEPLNLDDYKNWQLKQAADTLRLDRVLQETLTDLAEQDPYWNGISLSDLKQSSDIYWYDTGIWQLEVINQDRSRAEMAAQTWLDHGFAFIVSLQEASEEAAFLDSELQVIKSASINLKRQVSRLEAFEESSSQWIETLKGLAQDQTLPEDLQLDLQNWISFYEGNEGLWQIPLGDYPGHAMTPAQYYDWLTAAQLEASVVLEETNREYQLLLEDRDSILEDYHQALDDSLGLSANLVLEPNTSQPLVSQVRATGTATLLGSVLGLLAWFVYTVIRVRGHHDGQS